MEALREMPQGEVEEYIMPSEIKAVVIIMLSLLGLILVSILCDAIVEGIQASHAMGVCK